MPLDNRTSVLSRQWDGGKKGKGAKSVSTGSVWTANQGKGPYSSKGGPQGYGGKVGATQRFAGSSKGKAGATHRLPTQRLPTSSGKGNLVPGSAQKGAKGNGVAKAKAPQQQYGAKGFGTGALSKGKGLSGITPIPGNAPKPAVSVSTGSAKRTVVYAGAKAISVSTGVKPVKPAPPMKLLPVTALAKAAAAAGKTAPRVVTSLKRVPPAASKPGAPRGVIKTTLKPVPGATARPWPPKPFAARAPLKPVPETVRPLKPVPAGNGKPALTPVPGATGKNAAFGSRAVLKTTLKPVPFARRWEAKAKAHVQPVAFSDVKPLPKMTNAGERFIKNQNLQKKLAVQAQSRPAASKASSVLRFNARAGK